MNVFRHALFLSLAGSALVARADSINFDNLGSGVGVGNAYLASDGVSFVGGTALAYPTAPSAPNVLIPDAATLFVNSPSNLLVTSVSLFYSSNSVASGGSNGVPTLSVYSGPNGTGTPLGTLLLPDTSANFTIYNQVTLPFAGGARSIVLNDAASSHILYDNLSFTSQPAPEPSVLSTLGVGLVALLRRKRR